MGRQAARSLSSFPDNFVPGFAEEGKLEPTGAFADSSASEALKKVLEPKGNRVTLSDGTVLCESG